MDNCSICGKEIEEIFSLCNDCDKKTDRWDEDKDTYHMKDGSRYTFSPKSNQYEKRGR